MTPPLRIRDWDLEDWPFVLSSWLRSYHDRPSESPAVDVPNELYFADAGQHGIVTSIFNDVDTRIVVACSEDDWRAIFGWAAFGPTEPATLHYVYVKSPYRKLGVARALLSRLTDEPQPETIHCTHWTRALRTWRARGLPYVYNPYALRGTGR